MNNAWPLTTLNTQDTGKRQTKTLHNTGNEKDEQHGFDKKQRWNHVLAKSNQFMLFIIHPPCYL
jgi:hypothetical protein